MVLIPQLMYQHITSSYYVGVGMQMEHIAPIHFHFLAQQWYVIYMSPSVLQWKNHVNLIIT